MAAQPEVWVTRSRLGPRVESNVLLPPPGIGSRSQQLRDKKLTLEGFLAYHEGKRVENQG